MGTGAEEMPWILAWIDRVQVKNGKFNQIKNWGA